MTRPAWRTVLLALAAMCAAACSKPKSQVQCDTPADCPEPESVCATATCSSKGKCGKSFVPNGRALEVQTPGDCVKVVCDGKGGERAVIDESDGADDGNPCTLDQCQKGEVVHRPLPAGTSCGASMACDAAGQCVATDCGNGWIDGPEACDGKDLGGKTCASQGFTGGSLSCKANCTLDTAACTGGAQCGNGAIDGAEACDGADLGGKTCESLGFTGGALSCKTGCTLDKSGCTGSPCGNGTLDADEECDGTNLGGKSCQSEGFDGGQLGCTAECALDESGCTGGSQCGNGAVEEGELCDGGDLAGAPAAHGLHRGVLAAVWLHSTPALHRGQGALEGPRPCDLNEMGARPARPGFAGGQLACTAECALDNTAATSAASAWSGRARSATRRTSPARPARTGFGAGSLAAGPTAPSTRSCARPAATGSSIPTSNATRTTWTARAASRSASPAGPSSAARTATTTTAAASSAPAATASSTGPSPATGRTSTARPARRWASSAACSAAGRCAPSTPPVVGPCGNAPRRGGGLRRERPGRLTCEGLGFGGGALACRRLHAGHDGCTARPAAGTGRERGRQCDGTDLGGKTCQTRPSRARSPAPKLRLRLRGLAARSRGPSASTARDTRRPAGLRGARLQGRSFDGLPEQKQWGPSCVVA
jgi:hypothetical protein